MSEKSQFRSSRWYAREDRYGHSIRERSHQAGYTRADFAGKPVVGILSTWSEMTPCHIHFRQRAEEIKRGVWQAGGFPVEIPVMSLGETMIKPTTMLYRNFLAIEVEEVIRCHPLDSVVLMAGCDKTTPAMLMGALSMNVPAIVFPAGPMLNGHWNGRVVGSGTDAQKLHMEISAGRRDAADLQDLEQVGARSFGHCMTMGTASTMTALAEVLGLALPGASSIPAADSRHIHLAVETGRLAVRLASDGPRPKDLVNSRSLKNAIRVLMAIGGSTNAVVHLAAIARRAGHAVGAHDFNSASEEIPTIANLRPSGAYLMEDFFYAGGLSALLNRLGSLLDRDTASVNGRTLGDNIVDALCHNDDVIRPIHNPINPKGAIVVLSGSLAPNGAVIKRSAASAPLMKHTGRAVVFTSFADLKNRIDSPDLDVDENSVLVLQNTGPKGAPGMPERGQLPIPQKLLKRGVTDMVRISDARMSGTSFGTVVLHVAPEAAAGGPLGLVRDGDLICLDVAARRLDLLVDPETLAQRKPSVAIAPERGWARIYYNHVKQADEGADLDILGGLADSDPPWI